MTRIIDDKMMKIYPQPVEQRIYIVFFFLFDCGSFLGISIIFLLVAPPRITSFIERRAPLLILVASGNNLRDKAREVKKGDERTFLIDEEYPKSMTM
jgi:hypothetical protein